jgi:tetratricopeptide (TPR) repeat protein
LVLTLHGRHGAAVPFFDASVAAFERAGDRLSVPMGQLYKCHCLLYQGLVDEALALARTAVEQLRSEECSISVWARQARYVMGTIGAAILQLGYRTGKTVPLHLRVGLFSLGQVLHAAGRLEEASASFESALRSPLPAGAREWDLFLVQDGWYLEHLLATGYYAQARDYIRGHINRCEDSRLAEAIAAIGHARMGIADLETPESVDDLAERIERMAEALDSRTKPHLIHALLELAARSRGLGDLGLAESLLGQAREACAAASIRLLEVDCLLEDAWIKLAWGQAHAATQLHLEARGRIDAWGYRLRVEDAERLAAAIARRGD